MIPRILTGVLIGLAASGVIYAGAATTATAIASSYGTIESARHSRIVAIASTVKGAWVEHGLARARCERLARPQKNICRDDARATALAAVRSSRQL
jgi:hypothetical protein